MKTTMAYGRKMVAGLALAALLGGCATPSSEDDFGNSVRRMVEAQKYEPAPPPASTAPTLDGQKAEAALGQYRKDVGDPNRIRQGMDSGSTSNSQ